MKKNKLTKAFKELRKLGYIAKQNWMCCQNCGLHALPDDCAKYVFYHAQDKEGLDENGSTYLAWGGDGEEITSVLSKHGMSITWDHSDKTRILVENVFEYV